MSNLKDVIKEVEAFLEGFSDSYVWQQDSENSISISWKEQSMKKCICCGKETKHYIRHYKYPNQYYCKECFEEIEEAKEKAKVVNFLLARLAEIKKRENNTW